MIATPVKRPASPVQQNNYKRIRMMSDSSTEGDKTPQKVADELPFDDKLKYLHDKYPTFKIEVDLLGCCCLTLLVYKEMIFYLEATTLRKVQVLFWFVSRF